MLSILKNYYNKYSIFIIVLLVIIITCLLKCKPDIVEVTKDVRVPITSVKLPTPIKKKVVSNKPTLPIGENTTDVVINDTTSVDSVLEYTGKHEVVVNDKPAYIPYSITSTGKVVDFKLGINYKTTTIVRDTRLKAYILGTYNLKQDAAIGVGLASPRYITTYTYNPFKKEHVVGVGVKLFTIH